MAADIARDGEESEAVHENKGSATGDNAIRGRVNRVSEETVHCRVCCVYTDCIACCFRMTHPSLSLCLRRFSRSPSLTPLRHSLSRSLSPRVRFAGAARPAQPESAVSSLTLSCCSLLCVSLLHPLLLSLPVRVCRLAHTDSLLIDSRSDSKHRHRITQSSSWEARCLPRVRPTTRVMK